jgi:hypothetical protein
MATNLFVNRFLYDLKISSEVGREGQARGGKPVAAPPGKWIPPPSNCTKVNVDTTVAKLTVKGAVGIVCRSGAGVFLGASAIVFDGINHHGSLEALACREALDIADDLLLGHICVASDCLEVVQGLHGENLGVFGSILIEIKIRARQREGTSFKHEKRGSNVEAHRLARYATCLPAGRHVWFLEPPVGLNMHVTIIST